MNMTFRHRPRYVAAALALSTMVFPAAGAWAQINTIVVTVERREESLQTVPVSVSAFDRTTLEIRQIFSPNDLERYTPSLKMRQNITSPTNLSPALRGSTQQDASLAVAESPFGVYVDDIYMARLSGNNIELADLERVEVLRGPQGTLYGRNTLSGAIKFVTRTPSPENEWVNAAVGLGNFGRYRIGFSVGQSINDAISASASFQGTGYDGYSTNVATGESLGMEENYAGRIKLHYHGRENFDAVASVSYSDSENNGLPLLNGTTPDVPSDQQYEFDDVVITSGRGKTDRPTADRSPVIENEPRGDTEQLIASLDMSLDLDPDITLRSITGYVDTQDLIITDFSGLGTIMFDTFLDTRQFSQEIHVLGTLFDQQLDYLAGFYFFDDQADQSFNWYFFGPTSISSYELKTRSLSGFVQMDFNATENLTLTAGARYTRDRKRFDMSFNLVGAPPVEPINLDNTFTAWTPKFGVDYNVPNSFDFVDTMLLYASAGKGFKSGGYSAITIFGADDARTPYGPETNWTYEGGIKTDMFDNRLRVNANYFYADISELTLNATVPLGEGRLSFPVQNAGEAVIHGAEIEAVASPIEGLNIFLIAEILNAKFTSFNQTSAPANAVTNYNVADPKPPSVPDYALTLGFDFNYPGSLGSLDAVYSFGMDWYYSDNYTSAATNDAMVSSFDRINAFAAIDLGEHWRLSFTMENVPNKGTIQTGSRGLGGYYMWPPRNYMFKLSYSS